MQFPGRHDQEQSGQGQDSRQDLGGANAFAQDERGQHQGPDGHGVDQDRRLPGTARHQGAALQGEEYRRLHQSDQQEGARRRRTQGPAEDLQGGEQRQSGHERAVGRQGERPGMDHRQLDEHPGITPDQGEEHQGGETARLVVHSAGLGPHAAVRSGEEAGKYHESHTPGAGTAAVDGRATNVADRCRRQPVGTTRCPVASGGRNPAGEPILTWHPRAHPFRTYGGIRKIATIRSQVSSFGGRYPRRSGVPDKTCPHFAHPPRSPSRYTDIP